MLKKVINVKKTSEEEKGMQDIMLEFYLNWNKDNKKIRSENELAQLISL